MARLGLGPGLCFFPPWDWIRQSQGQGDGTVLRVLVDGLISNLYSFIYIFKFIFNLFSDVQSSE